MDIIFYDFTIPAHLVPIVAGAIVAVMIVMALILTFVIRGYRREIRIQQERLRERYNEIQEEKEKTRVESNERYAAERRVRDLEKEIEEGNGNLDQEAEGELITRVDELVNRVDELTLENEHLRGQLTAK